MIKFINFEIQNQNESDETIINVDNRTSCFQNDEGLSTGTPTSRIFLLRILLD